MAQERTCPICNTVNEADYIYCKNCGTHLPPVVAAQPAPQPTVAQPHVTYTPPVQTPPTADQADTVCGVTVAEANAFIGPNADTFIPKFKNLECGASAGWNWPVFLFSFLLNLPFVWFFYRKMYKAGAWVLALSVALSIAATACCSGMLNSMFGPVFDYLFQNQDLLYAYSAEAFPYSDPALGIIEEELANIAANGLISGIGYFLVLPVIGIAQLVLCVLLAAFANKMYYNHCTKKMQALRGQFGGMIPPAPLRLAGGTNTGAAVAVGIIVPAVVGIIQSLPILQFLSMIMQFINQNMYY